MNAGTRIFWLLIAILLFASLYFGTGIEDRRGAETPRPAHSVTPEGGH